MNYEQKVVALDDLVELVVHAYLYSLSKGSVKPDKDALFSVWCSIIATDSGLKAKDMPKPEHESNNNTRKKNSNSAKSKKALSDDANQKEDKNQFANDKKAGGTELSEL